MINSIKFSWFYKNPKSSTKMYFFSYPLSFFKNNIVFSVLYSKTENINDKAGYKI